MPKTSKTQRILKMNEINKIQCGQIEKINKIKNVLLQVFKKINKVNKLLEKLTKETTKREVNCYYQNIKVDMKQKAREYYKNFMQIHLKTQMRFINLLKGTINQN